MIYLGSKELGILHVGDKEIQKVWLGDKLIWENIKVVDLGEGQTFNVSSYPNYSQLTEDNFFFLTSTSQAKLTGNVPSGIVYTSDGIEKSYNSSTGILTLRTKVESGNKYYGNVHAVLIPNPQKLIYLGNAQSFNLVGYKGYKNFTVSNFLIKNCGGGSIGGIRDPLGYTATADIVKTYDANNGILNCYLFGEFLSSKPHTETWSSSRRDNCEVYLLKKGVS